MDELNLSLDELINAADDLTRSESDRRGALSRLANEVEQRTRKYIFGSPDDPLKYCYNIWGAQVGAWLYDERLPVKARTPPDVPIDSPRSPWGSDVFTTMIRTTRELAKQGAAAGRIAGGKIRTLLSGSPVNITWNGGGYSMLLDQRTQNLYGEYPVHLLPIWHASSRTWGALWVDVGDTPADMAFEATDDGVHHLIISDGGGEPQLYSVEVRRGDRLTMTVGAGGSTQLTRFDGTVVAELVSGGGHATPPTPPSPPTIPERRTEAWDPGAVELDLVIDASGDLTDRQLRDVHHALLMLSLDTGVEAAVVFVPPISREQAAVDCGRWREHLVAHGVLPSDSALLLFGGDGRGYSRTKSVDATVPIRFIKQAWNESAGQPDLPSRVAAQLRRLRELVVGD